MNKQVDPDNTALIRIKLDTYHKLEKIKQKKRYKNLQETGKVGDADFDSIINDLLDKNGNIDYNPIKGGEGRGERKHGQMAEETSTESNSSGLDVAQRESCGAVETRVEDKETEEKINTKGGEVASL